MVLWEEEGGGRQGEEELGFMEKLLHLVHGGRGEGGGGGIYDEEEKGMW